MPQSIKHKLKKWFTAMLAIAVVASAMYVATPVADAAAKKSTRVASSRTAKKSKKSKKSTKRKSTKKKRRSTARNRKKRRSRRAHVHTRRAPLIIRGTTGTLPQYEPFVIFDREDSIGAGLEGRNIAVWPSHGLYYSENTNRWQWQRPRLFTTVEDLLSTTFVNSYLVPMLENAGAYVMMPRERDWSPHEAVSDNNRSLNATFVAVDGINPWKATPDSTGYLLPTEAIYGDANPFVAGNALMAEAIGFDQLDAFDEQCDDEDSQDDTASDNTTDSSDDSTAPTDPRLSVARWHAAMPERGVYAIYVTYPSFANSAPDATYTINHLGGSTNVTVNQRMGGGTWIYLGSYELPAGDNPTPVVELANTSALAGSIISADAVKVGGGIGNVAWTAPDGHPFTSGAPRFNEGASTYLRGAGMPRGVWDASNGESLYKNDYMSRAHWANHLAGGSPILPDTVGLGIPVDMAFAFHTDAGIADEVVGSLALYSTDDGNPFGNGSSREANSDLANKVLNSIMADVTATYDPTWNSRGSRDRKYYEVRETKMPAMIIEALSHQNFIDMQRGHDPEFKFILSRAIYKGILRFLAARYGTEAVVQPLPVHDFAIDHTGHGKYRLSWKPTPDSLEPGAMPSYYVIEERVDSGGFHRLESTTQPLLNVEISDNSIPTYRIIAGNDGGTSFPSEALALFDNGGQDPTTTIVNGFTRVSGPGIDPSGQGFDLENDPAVADGVNLGTVGRQFDFDRQSGFVENDFPGWGNSRGNLERHRVAGNTHDYTAIHGEALKAAGQGFVSTSASAFEQSDRRATPIIDLLLGLQKGVKRAGSGEIRHTVLSPAMRRRLEAHAEKGGKLFVSGSYVASELLNNPQADSLTRLDTQHFANKAFGIDTVVERATITGSARVAPETNSPFRPNYYTFDVVNNNKRYTVTAPEAIYPAAGAK
ncbi:MAG: N-acetylmuramoyl-L-alanine amidase, partial [Muribaculaceae bacterium]|nr:N-acetylmuramoyl-L-alanine amidase [Muribaculaceae bacterium]